MTTAAAVDDHPLVASAREYAEQVLRPAALRTDQYGVGAQRIDELRWLGLLNHLAPETYGGAALGVAEDRRLHEVIAGACFNTWLVWAQHAPAARRLTTTPATTPLVEQVLRGRALLGAGISDVRRYPHRYVAADRVVGGWTLRGTLSWVSGWGLHDALTVSAVEPDSERVVTALVVVDDRIRASPLDLSVVTGSRTERVLLDGVPVADDQVLSIETLEASRRADVDLATDARPHHFGLAETVLRELDESGDPLAIAVASSWRPRVARMRTQAYALNDGAVAAGPGAPPYRVGDRLELKVAILGVLTTLTQALVATRSGRGLVGDDTAQLHTRSALFAQVQGQSPAVRAAQLAQYAR